MAKKRQRDAEIWEQSWFVDMSPESKLVWDFVNDKCHSSGIWKIDAVELARKTGLKKIDFKKFVDEANRDYDKLTGEPIKRERVRIIDGGRKIWITTHLLFQWGGEKEELSPTVPAVKGGLNNLHEHGLLVEAIDLGYVKLSITGFEQLFKVIKGWQGLTIVNNTCEGLPTTVEEEVEGFKKSYTGGIVKGGVVKQGKSEKEIGKSDGVDIIPDEEIEGVKYFFAHFNNILGGSDELRKGWVSWINRNHIRGTPVDVITANAQLKFLRGEKNALELIQNAIINGWSGLKYDGRNLEGGKNGKNSIGKGGGKFISDVPKELDSS